jgi:glycosyltransferase involved in cell wall biosynthesis
MNNTKLIIVVPCYNEEEVLQETTRQLSTVLSGMEQEGKITEGKLLYVDDGSRDATWHIIEQLSTENPRVMGLKLAHNVGHQQALWAGLEWAANAPFDAIVSIDADLQDDVQAIVEMTERFNEGTDIVYGVRKERKTDTFFKKHTAQAFYKLMQTMGGDVVYNHADFRLMSKRALQALVAHPERNLFLRGIVRSLGYPSDFVYYDRHERFAGESKYPLSKMLNFAIDGITSFSVKPLRLITTFGLLFMFVAIVIIGYALYEHLIGHTIVGWTSLLVSMWFIGGAILTAIGIIGEYIGKIYKEVKRRPRYFIEKQITQKQV